MAKTIQKKKVKSARLSASKKKVRVRSDGSGKKAGLKPSKRKSARSGKIVKNKKTACKSTKLIRSSGCSGSICVQDNHGTVRDKVSSTFCFTAANRSPRSKKKTATAVGRTVNIPSHLPEVLAAVAHKVRLRILLKLLDGPAIYRSLKKLTQLEAGPLYHHIHQLRLAGLILPKQRDLYELTRGGRNTIITVMSLGLLSSDRRRRPGESR